MDVIVTEAQANQHAVTGQQLSHGVHHASEQAVAILLQGIGEDPSREGLQDTPARVVRALFEMTAGYRESPHDILATTFAEPCDEMVVVRGIAFTSLCEHHLLPFTGTVDLAYVPGKSVVGLSKLPRLVDCFARRLQLQERMTQQIAQAIGEHINPRGVAVVARGEHACMSCRGVRKADARMITSAMLGIFKSDAKCRAEFLSLVA